MGALVVRYDSAANLRHNLRKIVPDGESVCVYALTGDEMHALRSWTVSLCRFEHDALTRAAVLRARDEHNAILFECPDVMPSISDILPFTSHTRTMFARASVRVIAEYTTHTSYSWDGDSGTDIMESASCELYLADVCGRRIPFHRSAKTRLRQARWKVSPVSERVVRITYAGEWIDVLAADWAAIEGMNFDG